MYSLREKRIATVACGGLHNVAATADGAVFTWGCNDDGSLGRGGEENLPARVEGGGLAGHEARASLDAGRARATLVDARRRSSSLKRGGASPSDPRARFPPLRS